MTTFIAVVVRLSQKKESIGQLKGVKSIFESVINAHSKINTPKNLFKCSVIKTAYLFLSQKQYIFSNKKKIGTKLGEEILDIPMKF